MASPPLAEGGDRIIAQYHMTAMVIACSAPTLGLVFVNSQCCLATGIEEMPKEDEQNCKPAAVENDSFLHGVRCRGSPWASSPLEMTVGFCSQRDLQRDVTCIQFI